MVIIELMNHEKKIYYLMYEQKIVGTYKKYFGYAPGYRSQF